MHPSPISRQPVAVERCGGRAARLSVIPAGAAAVFAPASIGAAATRMGTGVDLESVRVLPAGTSFLGVPAPVDSLLVPSPSAGAILIGVAALMSLGLVWLGHELDWGARSIAPVLPTASRTIHAVSRRVGLHLGSGAVQLVPCTPTQSLPAYSPSRSFPTLGQTRRRIA